MTRTREALAQYIHALERAESALQQQADELHEAHDYSAEFPAHDAECLREVIKLVRSIGTQAMQWTPRQLRLMEYAVWRFMNSAYSQAAAAAEQKGELGPFKPSAAAAFAQDAEDAREIVSELRVMLGTQPATPEQQTARAIVAEYRQAYEQAHHKAAEQVWASMLVFGRPNVDVRVG